MIATDLAIVGAGAAGLSAAAAAAARGLDVLVIERMGAGGQVLNVERIMNFPGQPEGISGFELGPLLQEKAEAAGAKFLLDTVQQLAPADGGIALQCEGETVLAGAVLVAAGSVRRKLNVPGEAQLEGRGVSHCASCDGPLFRRQAVCVVGGGDSAFGEAAILAAHASRVTIVFQGAQPHAQPELLAEVAALPNVTLLPNAEVVEITGEQGVTGVRVRASDAPIAAEGVFVYPGLEPDRAFLPGVLERDDDGRIRTDANFHTSLTGVFAAGDIRAGAAYLLAAAADEGAAAALAAVRYLRDTRGATDP